MARRLNKNLVVGLTITGMMIIAGAGALLVYSLPGRDPKPMADKAVEALAKASEIEKELKTADTPGGSAATEADRDKLRAKRRSLQEQLEEQYARAAQYYIKAYTRAQASGKSAEAAKYMINAGDLALRAGNARDALSSWDRVYLNDTKNKEAQERIVKLRLELAELYPSQDTWKELREKAERLLADDTGSAEQATDPASRPADSEDQNTDRPEWQLTPARRALALHALGRSILALSAANPQEIDEAGKNLAQALELSEADPQFANSLALFQIQSLEARIAAARKELNSIVVTDLEQNREEAIRKGLEIYDRMMAALEKKKTGGSEKPETDNTDLASAWRKRGYFLMAAQDISQVSLQEKRRSRATQGEIDRLSALVDKYSAEALACLEKALAYSPDDVETLVLLGQYWQSKLSKGADDATREAETEANYDKAKDLYAKAIKIDPDTLEAYQNLQAYYGRQAEAAMRQKPADDSPEAARAQRETARKDMMAHYDRAAQVLTERIERGAVQGGVRLFAEKEALANFRFQLFNIKSTQIEHLRELERQGVDADTKRIVDADTKRILEQLRAIRRDFVAERREGEKHPLALFMGGRIHMLDPQGRSVDAIKSFRELDTQLTTGDRLWSMNKLLLAQLYMQINEAGMAIENLEAVNKVQPNETALAMLAAALEAVPERLADAEDAANKALALNPRNPQALNTLARVYEKQKNWKKLDELRAQVQPARGGSSNELLEASLLLSKGMDPDNPDPAAVEQGRAKLRRILEAEPSNKDALRTLVSTLQSEAHRQEAAMLLANAAKDVESRLRAAKAAGPDGEEEAKRLTAALTNIKLMELLSDQNTPTEERLAKMDALIRQNADPEIVEWELYRLYLGTPGRQDEAVQHLKKAYELKPDSPDFVEALFRASVSSFKDADGKEIVKPDWDLAQKLVGKAKELGLDRSDGHFFQGQLALAKGDVAQAEQEFRESIRIFPVNSNGYAWLGRALGAQNRLDEAIEALEKSLAQNPRNTIAVQMLARIAVSRGDRENRSKYLKLCRELNLQADPWVAEQLQYLEDESDPAVAIRRREELRKSKPDDTANMVSLADLYARAGQTAKAKGLLADAHRIEPKNLRLLTEYVSFLNEQNPPDDAGADAAIAKTLESLESNDTNARAEVLVLRARHLEIQARRPGATQPSRESVEAAYLEATKAAENSRTMGEVANFYLRLGQPADAEEWFRKSLAKAQADKDKGVERAARQNIINLMLQVGDYKRVPQLQRELEDYRGRFDDGFRLMAAAAFDAMLGRETAAIEYITQYISTASGMDKAQGLFNRGKMSLRRGDFEKAVADLKDAKSLAPDAFNYDHRILLASSLQLTGQTELAVTELASILKQNSGNPRAAEALYQIYVENKRYDEAEAFILPLYQANPKVPNWTSLLSEIALKRNGPGDQNRAIQRAAETVQNTEFAPQAIEKLLTIYLSNRRYDEMLEYVAGKLPQANREDPRVQARVVTAHIAKGDLTKASAAYEAMLAKANLAVLDTYRLLLEATGYADKAKALAFMQAEAAKRPDDLFTQMVAVSALKSAADDETHAAALEQLLPKLPTAADSPLLILRIQAVQDLAAYYSAKKNPESARKLYEQMLELATQPSGPRVVALNNLAYLLIEDMGQPAAALPYAEEAVRLVPQYSDILDTLGWAQVLNKQYDQGIATLRRALASTQGSSQRASLHFHVATGLNQRAKQLRGQGQATQAEQDLAEARLDCRRAHESLLKSGTDAGGLLPRIVALGTELGLTLSPELPAKEPTAAK